MARLSFVTAILAVAAGVAAQSTNNPFAGFPDLSDLPICQTECAAVSQLQETWNGDYSQACTTSFATSLQQCLTCAANSALGPVLLTPDNQQLLTEALTSYTNACQQSGSPVSINVSSILASTPTATGSNTATVSNTASTASSTSSTGGALTSAHLSAGAIFGAVSVLAISLF
ncbi:hypothetical protein CPB86DRAFT_825043 [Serendipita vermifera]|nr:hypothetical protein CPB86DRAFT_825043 [Serendipita vermifera]